PEYPALLRGPERPQVAPLPRHPHRDACAPDRHRTSSRYRDGPVPSTDPTSPMTQLNVERISGPSSPASAAMRAITGGTGQRVGCTTTPSPGPTARGRLPG